MKVSKIDISDNKNKSSRPLPGDELWWSEDDPGWGAAVKWPREDDIKGILLDPIEIPSADERCRVPRGCIKEDCSSFAIGFYGSAFCYCIFQGKCIIRGSKAQLARVKALFEKQTEAMSYYQRIAFMFENMGYAMLSQSQTDWVEKLLYGEYGFEKRRRLSEKQYKILLSIYLDSKRKEAQL